MALTPKQEKFVQGLFVGLSQRSAYKEAYPDDTSTDKTIDNNAYNLAKDREILERLEQLKKEVAAMNMLSESYVVQNLIELQQRCMQKIPVMEFNKETREWEHTGEWKFDSAGANGALEKLGKYLKMFVDRSETKNVNMNTEMSAEEVEKIIAKHESKS